MKKVARGTTRGLVVDLAVQLAAPRWLGQGEMGVGTGSYGISAADTRSLTDTGCGKAAIVADAHRTMSSDEQPSVAFVLSGGASLGAIQVGMLRALYELPLHIVAVDVISGEELRLSSGPLNEAVLASAALPAILAPVRWGDRCWSTAAWANNTPISHAVALRRSASTCCRPDTPVRSTSRRARRSRWRCTRSACSPNAA